MDSAVHKAKVTNAQFIDAYLRIWNGGLKLTEVELKVVKVIIQAYMKHHGNGLNEPYLTDIVFSIKSVNAMRKELKFSTQNWGNYQKKLKEKSVLLEKDDVVFLNPAFIPKKEITFKFEIID
jgi:DNA-directed RNA polymerase